LLWRGEAVGQPHVLVITHLKNVKFEEQCAFDHFFAARYHEIPVKVTLKTIQNFYLGYVVAKQPCFTFVRMNHEQRHGALACATCFARMHKPRFVRQENVLLFVCINK